MLLRDFYIDEHCIKELLKPLYDTFIDMLKEVDKKIEKNTIDGYYYEYRDGCYQCILDEDCEHNWHGPYMDKVSRYFKCSKCLSMERDAIKRF